MEVNLLSVLIATVLAYVAGAVWYGPLFGKAWMELRGMKPEDLQKGTSMTTLMVATFVILFVSAFVLDLFIGPDATLNFAMMAALSVGVVWVAGFTAINALYDGKSMKYFLINAGYQVLVYAIMGLVLGLM